MRLKFESMHYKIDYECSLDCECHHRFFTAFDVCGDCVLIPYVRFNYCSYCEF